MQDLTLHFTNEKTCETGVPYSFRRQIKSTDNRFDSFEIVYEKYEKFHYEKVRAVVFDFKIKLSEIEVLFGEHLMANQPYDESTEFAFKSINPEISIIKTRHPEWLKVIGKRRFEYLLNNQVFTIDDPVFNFIQFKLNE